MLGKVELEHWGGKLRLTAMANTLRPDLPAAEDNPLVAGYLPECHRAAGMKFLGAYAYLSTQAKLRAVGEAGAGIGINAGSIHLVEKPHCC